MDTSNIQPQLSNSKLILLKRKPTERIIDFFLLIHHQLNNQSRYFQDLVQAIHSVQLDNDNQNQERHLEKQKQKIVSQTLKQQTKTQQVKSNNKQSQIGKHQKIMQKQNQNHIETSQNHTNKQQHSQTNKQSFLQIENTGPFQRFKNSIINKQKQAFDEFFSNLQLLDTQKTEQNHQQNNKKDSQKIQQANNDLQVISAKLYQQQNDSQQNISINDFVIKQPQNSQNNNNLSHNQNLKTIQRQNQKDISKQTNSNSKIDQAKGFCQVLKVNYKQKVYNQANIDLLVYNLNQIIANNSYLCIQDSFEFLKSKFYTNVQKNQTRNSKINKSFRRSEVDSQFNLQLTIKSKMSKNSMNVDRQDSLIYSNATSFGLTNTNNRSKQQPKNIKSSKIIGLKDENDFDMIHIDKTSSKGDVQNQQRQFSAKSFSDTQRIGKYPPKGSNQHKSHRNSSNKNSSNRNSSEQRINLSIKQLGQEKQKIPKQLNQKRSPIKEQDNYEILSYENQNLQDNFQNQENHNSPFNENVKKSFSIRSYNSRKNNAKINGKKSGQVSVFSSQINSLQTRISRIKQTKMLRKKKLEEQLNKVNQEIQQLKKQQGSKQKQQGHRQNTMESRIKINDNLEQKKKAAKLVKNLRAQKISRQNLRKRQIKVLDKDIHQKMQQIMKLKYFNEQKVKQKKKLQIIQRMKLQQIRKIAQQQQKQQSVQFLTKLKHGGIQSKNQDIPSNHQEIVVSNMNLKEQMIQNSQSKRRLYQNIQQRRIQKNINLNQSRDKQIYRTPVKRTQSRQIQQPLSNPILQKKKAYLHKIRNFTVVKRQKPNLYQQILN